MSAQKPRLLIVEDASFDASALRQMLEGDYEVILGEPKAPLDADDAELVILGAEAKAVRESLAADPDGTPLFVMGCPGDEGIESLLLNAGVSDFLPLPVRPSVTRARLRAHLENRRFRSILQRITWLDAVTGLPSQDKLEESLVCEWRRNARNHTAISLVLMEIDHFGPYCELHGKAAGDEALRSIIGALTGGIQRAGDVVGRYRDQVLALVLPETDTVGAVSVCERIRAEVNSMAMPHGASPVAAFLTLSLGVASLAPGRNNLLDDLREEAEEALARAHQRGGNQVVFS